MAIISQGVLVLAMVWTLWQLVRVRRQLRSGAIVVPPLVAATLVFALGIIVVIMTGVSPLHLLWWFPCSFIVGLVMLVFPLGNSSSAAEEVARVTAINSNTLTITRNVGGAGADTITATGSIRIIGSAYQEGDNVGVPLTP